jgi:anionic cell wall polymer biosynthesis LytR-Cps2A-Psr (LCP) family protein
LASVISIVLIASAALPAAATDRLSSFDLTGPALRILSAVAPSGGALLQVMESGSTIRYGADGRLTMLLVGSDYRPKLAGERTDIIIVISINPKTKQVAAVSVPRDIARLQRPASLGGGTFAGRVNTIFSYYNSSLKNRLAALDRLRQIIAFNLQVEIDYSALIRMTAFEKLIDNIGGITANIPTEIKDPKFWDDPRGPQGIYFPQATGWALKGVANTPLCNGAYKTGNWSKPGSRCQRALVYVRTRKGTGNSDFKRTKRAQDVVGATVRKVVQRGSGSNLSALLNAAVSERNAGAITTNLPTTSSDAVLLFNLLNGSSLSRQAVLKPTKYASKIPYTATYQLKLAEVRALTKLWFAPVN